MDIPVNDLLEFLRNAKPKGFIVHPFYSVEGDMLIVYFEDAPAHTVNLTPDVHLERADNDNRIVGVKIFGVRELTRMSKTT